MESERLAIEPLAIRRAVVADVPAIVRLVNLAYRVEAFFIDGDRTSGGEIERLLARGAFLIAERGAAPEIAAGAAPARSGGAPGVESRRPGGATGAATRAGAAGTVFVEGRGDHGYIGLLSVEPEVQGAGIGRALMAAAEEVCRDGGLPRVELLVVDLRQELRPWYRRLGYREVGTRPFPPDTPVKRPCHFVVMSKRLSRPPSV